MRTSAIITTVVLSASLVAGCGSSSGDKTSSGSSGDKGSSSSGDYCKQLKAAKADFDTFNSGTPDFSKFDDAIGTFHKLADNAPSDVAADWKTLDEALSSMEKALSDAGLKISDLSAITSGKLPDGMTPAQLQELGPKLQAAFAGLDTDAAQKAGDAIEKNAKSKCGVDLSK
ncbi:hypothetical protein ACVW00_001701 [Marmoricola sp. URHA0025 HA25]